MDAETAARRWAQTWTRAWPAHYVEAITSLYAEDAAYRALVFREPDLGLAGVRTAFRGLVTTVRPRARPVLR